MHIETQTFTLNQAQLRRMLWAGYQNNIVLMAVLLMGMGSLAYWLRPNPQLFLIVLLVLLLYLVVVSLSIRSYVKRPEFAAYHAPRYHVFRDAGVETVLNTGARSTIPWAQVRSLRLRYGFALVTYVGGALHPIPQAMIQPADWQTLKAFRLPG